MTSWKGDPLEERDAGVAPLNDRERVLVSAYRKLEQETRQHMDRLEEALQLSCDRAEKEAARALDAEKELAQIKEFIHSRVSSGESEDLKPPPSLFGLPLPFAFGHIAPALQEQIDALEVAHAKTLLELKETSLLLARATRRAHEFEVRASDLEKECGILSKRCHEMEAHLEDMHLRDRDRTDSITFLTNERTALRIRVEYLQGRLARCRGDSDKPSVSPSLTLVDLPPTPRVDAEIQTLPLRSVWAMDGENSGISESCESLDHSWSSTAGDPSWNFSLNTPYIAEMQDRFAHMHRPSGVPVHEVRPVVRVIPPRPRTCDACVGTTLESPETVFRLNGRNDEGHHGFVLVSRAVPGEYSLSRREWVPQDALKVGWDQLRSILGVTDAVDVAVSWLRGEKEKTTNGS